MCPLFALVCFSDAISVVCFVGDGKQCEGESDRYEGDKHEEGKHVGDITGIHGQKTCVSE